MKRPVGVSIIAIPSIVFPVLFLFGGGLGAADRMGPRWGGLLLFFVALGLTVGIGLWLMKNWARILTISVAVLIVALVLYYSVGMLLMGQSPQLTWFGGFLTAGCLWAIWYLSRKPVRDAFHTKRE